jgi:hypothetical protein
MTFTNEYPKKEITIITNVKIGSLTSDNNAEIHFRDFKGYLDTVQHIVLTGSRNVWHEIKWQILKKLTKIVLVEKWK